MAELILTIQNYAGLILTQAKGQEQVSLYYQGLYKKGDTITLHTSMPGSLYLLQLDDAMKPALCYLSEETYVYNIPYGDNRLDYSTKSFSGNKHLITVRLAKPYEYQMYRNLALNPYDQFCDSGCFPHIISASQRPEIAENSTSARNIIDGIHVGHAHGEWPYSSWEPTKLQNAALCLYFGRPVLVDKIVLFIRGDFPHDSYWASALLHLSDDSDFTITLTKTDAPQVFPFPAKMIHSIQIDHLKSQDPASCNCAFTQLEIYGTDIVSF